MTNTRIKQLARTIGENINFADLTDLDTLVPHDMEVFLEEISRVWLVRNEHYKETLAKADK